MRPVVRGVRLAGLGAHAHRDQHWRVLEVVEPQTGQARPREHDRYILVVTGPMAYLPGWEDESYIEMRRHGDGWVMESHASAYPRRDFPPGG